MPSANPDVIVGKIDDRFEITPTGQVSYEIPIKVPTGTGGMEPRISISYNGSKHNGLCGIGFDLTGLSVINRTPANLHVDERIGVVEVNANDCLMLDGQRLIQVADLGGGRKEWRTEQDSYSRIISQEGDSLGPSNFTVQTKAGLTYFYDATDSPHADCHNPDGTSQVHFLFWLLKRVEDSSGNYYTVTYATDHQGGEYWPTRIDYTGNQAQGLSPYASLRFDYSINPDSTVTYIGGLRIRNCRLLTSIKAYYGNHLVKQYCLTYQSQNNHRQLTEVTEIAADNKRLNPTTFTWHNSGNEPSELITVNGLNSLTGAKIVTGDLNGDGMTDVFAYADNDDHNWSGWYVYLGNPTGLTFSSHGIFNDGMNKKPEQVLCGDFNGDGLDDIYVKMVGTNGNTNDTWYAGKVYRSSVSPSTGHSLSFSQALTSTRDSYTAHLVKINNPNTKYPIASILLTYIDQKKADLYTAFASSLYKAKTFYAEKKWGDVRIGDFNGDGLSDIANHAENKMYFMTTNGVGMDYRTVERNSSLGGEFFYVGDFNGDGKSDILQIGSYGAESMRYSTGNFRFSNNPLDMSGWFPRSLRYSMSIADLDGDGRDDAFLRQVQQYPNYNPSYAYLNRSDGMRFVQSPTGAGTGTGEIEFFPGDFNGDGKVDLLQKSTADNQNNICRIFRSPVGASDLLASITDGMGNTTSVEYKSLADTAMHMRGDLNTDKFDNPQCCRSFSAGWPLVSRVTVPDGIGGTRSTNYRYHNALLHKRGRGLLGFERTVVDDESTATSTVTHYRIEPTEFVMTPTRQTVTVNGRLIEETEMSDTLVYHHHHVFSILPKESTTWKYEYNTGELVSQVTTRQEFDTHGNVTRLVTETPYRSVINVNTYADDTTLNATASRWLLGRLVTAEVTKSDGMTAQTLHTSFEYDTATGLLLKEAIEPADNQLGSSKTYTRDGFGNIVQSVKRANSNNSQSRTSKTLYDSKGRFITAMVNALGDTVRCIHDPLLCQPVMTIGANNDTTTFSYDSFGNLLQKTTALDTVTTATAYVSSTGGSLGYFFYQQATGQPNVIRHCDSFGRTTWTHTFGMDGGIILTETEYDHLGRVSRTSEPAFINDTKHWNANEYDPVGRVIRQTDPTGEYYTFSYQGLTTMTTDPLGRTTTKIVDMEGNLARSEDALGNTVEYEYDLDGHCTVVTGPRTTIVTEYDRLGRRVRLSDPDLGETTYQYNGFGELSCQTTNGLSTSYTYDALGRVQWEVLNDYLIIHSYDNQWKGAADQVTTTSSCSNAIIYNRDSHGRVTRQTEYIDGRSFVMQFAYNALNKLERVTYPNGLRLRYAYTDNGYLREVRDDSSGALYWRADAMDARGQLEQFTLGNGKTTTVTHNAAKGYIERIATPGVQDFSYALNEVGCLTSRTDNLRSMQETFAYDDLDRLVEVCKNGVATQQMTYDAAGNITSKTGVGTQLSYADGTNRLTSIRGGNYTPVQWNEIRYTSFNKVSYLAYGGSTLQLYYGWDRQRKLAKNTISGKITKHYYVDKYYEQVICGDTVKQTCYVYGPEGLVALVIRKDGTDSVRYCHKDHLGSVIGYTDETGALVQELSYDAWGRRRDPATWDYLPSLAAAMALDAHGFTGHEHLDLMEMLNMDGRMYDPVLGRFLSPDPLVQAPDFTQSLNRYAYCLNNPLSLTDPTGYSWFSRNWKSLLGSVVGIAVAAFTGGAAAGLAVAVIAGATGGAAGAMVGAILNGENFGQIVRSTLQGALFGAMSGGLNYLCGGVPNMVARLLMHSMADGVMQGVQGGNVLHGTLLGLLTAGSGEGMMALGGSLKTGAKLAVQAVIGGTLSELGGGNFANGAVTAAFAFLFNHLKHEDNSISKAQKMIRDQIEADGKLSFDEAYDWYKLGMGADIIVDADKLDIEQFISPDCFSGKDICIQLLPINKLTDMTPNQINQGKVYGSITIKYIGNNCFKIYADRYNFDYHRNTSNNINIALRNLGTIFSGTIHGVGRAYNIHFRGFYKYKRTNRVRLYK